MKAYYVALSETVRRYLGARFRLPALDRTTGELLHLLRDVEEARAATPHVRDILDLSDGAKFARRMGTLEEAGRAMEKSLEIVDRTKAVETATADAKGA